MEKEDPIEVIAKLREVAHDSDGYIIEQAAIDAGYFWRCQNPGKRGMPLCNYVNIVGEEKCQDCGSPCPPELRPPSPTVHVEWYYGVSLCGKPLDKIKSCRREEADKKSNCEVCLCRIASYLKSEHH